MEGSQPKPPAKPPLLQSPQQLPPQSKDPEPGRPFVPDAAWSAGAHGPGGQQNSSGVWGVLFWVLLLVLGPICILSLAGIGAIVGLAFYDDQLDVAFQGVMQVSVSSPSPELLREVDVAASLQDESLQQRAASEVGEAFVSYSPDDVALLYQEAMTVEPGTNGSSCSVSLTTPKQKLAERMLAQLGKELQNQLFSARKESENHRNVKKQELDEALAEVRRVRSERLELHSEAGRLRSQNFGFRHQTADNALKQIRNLEAADTSPRELFLVLNEFHRAAIEIPQDLREEVDKLQRDVPMPSREEARLKSLEVSRERLLASLGPDHPTIRNIDQQISNLKERIDAEREENDQGEDGDPEALTERIAGVIEQMESIARENIAEIEKREGEVAEKLESVEAEIKQHEQLLEQLEERNRNLRIEFAKLNTHGAPRVETQIQTSQQMDFRPPYEELLAGAGGGCLLGLVLVIGFGVVFRPRAKKNAA